MDLHSFTKKVLLGLGILMFLCLFVTALIRVTFVTYVENYQQGYEFNASNGEITILDRAGYFWRTPFKTYVYRIDKRPMQVCISANSRILNCKLVQFNSDAESLKLFVSWHGAGDYEGPTGGTSSSASGRLYDILMSYAYANDGKKYPFLTILEETGTVQAKP